MGPGLFPGSLTYPRKKEEITERRRPRRNLLHETAGAAAVLLVRCVAPVLRGRQDEARTGMTAEDLWKDFDGGKPVTILPGEQSAVFKVDGKIEIAKGPCALNLAKGDRYAQLTKLSASPKQYFKITRAK